MTDEVPAGPISKSGKKIAEGTHTPYQVAAGMTDYTVGVCGCGCVFVCLFYVGGGEERAHTSVLEEQAIEVCCRSEGERERKRKPHDFPLTYSHTHIHTHKNKNEKHNREKTNTTPPPCAAEGLKWGGSTMPPTPPTDSGSNQATHWPRRDKGRAGDLMYVFVYMYIDVYVCVCVCK
jgi:hypothetical protein